MPHKDDFDFPPWVERTDDECLRTILEEAVVARKRVIRAGITNRACRGAFKSAQATLEQLEYGAIAGSAAYKRASDALRKFSAALECTVPTKTKAKRR